MEMVILVDQTDKEIGTMEKMEAHKKGMLHRAFSVLIYNDKGEILLQKRSKNKYHSGGLWTNACCSHPLPEEEIHSAAKRRLKEEMGIDVQPEFAYKFIYKINLDHDLIEHECDHVFIGKFNEAPSINRNEVEDWKYINLSTLKKDVEINPEAYTHWFKLILNHPQINFRQ